MPTVSFQPILDAALADYTNQIGIDLVNHPLADSLRPCGSPDDVLKLLEDKANQFKDFRDGNRKLLNWLNPVVHVVHTLSAVLGASITLVSRKTPRSFHVLFFTNSVARFRSNQQRRYLLAWMFSLQCVSHYILRLHHLIISGSYRQPVASARATMRSSTCLSVSETSSNAFESTPISH